MAQKDELKKICTINQTSVVHGYGDGVEIEKGKYLYNPETKTLEKWIAPKKVAAPTVIKDEILEGIHSMLDDKIYYSRSEYLRSLKAAGYEVTGGDHLSRNHLSGPPRYEGPAEQEVRDHVEQAYYDVKYDRVEFSEKQKQLHKEENDKWAALK